MSADQWQKNETRAPAAVYFVNKPEDFRRISKMYPVKEIMQMKHLEPLPPVLVIDEMTIKCTTDAGPVCCCDEKVDLVNSYKPFLPGGVNPYSRRKIPDSESLEVFWKRLRIGSTDLLFEKPLALHQAEIPKNVGLPRQPEELQMQLQQPKYTEGYLKEKLMQCKREHSDGCNCPGK